MEARYLAWQARRERPCLQLEPSQSVGMTQAKKENYDSQFSTHWQFIRQKVKIRDEVRIDDLTVQSVLDGGRSCSFGLYCCFRFGPESMECVLCQPDATQQGCQQIRSNVFKSMTAA